MFSSISSWKYYIASNLVNNLTNINRTSELNVTSDNITYWDYMNNGGINIANIFMIAEILFIVMILFILSYGLSYGRENYNTNRQNIIIYQIQNDEPHQV